jgi:monomeric sarcosine oxidase
MRAVVIGGGVMGLATGCVLAAEPGVVVTVIERVGVAHSWASSHGWSRAIRHEYGPEAIYTHMVARSLTLWDELARETGVKLYTETGILTLGQPDDGHTLSGFEVMRAAGLPVERLTPDETTQRFPQFSAGDFGAITWNPVGGMLAASDCCAALAQRLRSRGGDLREGVGVSRLELAGSGAVVTLATGERLACDVAVVTAGPWVRKVLPDLDLPVTTTRQQVTYFSRLDERAFGVGAFPIFLAGMNEYGFPMHGPGWIKAGLHHFGAEVDPDAGYAPSDAETAAVRTFFRRVIPAAAEAKVEMVDRCMYDVTPDEDFILDYHPGGKGIVIGSGFSGHGFKFGPLIGEMLAALALGKATPFPLDRFALGRFTR